MIFRILATAASIATVAATMGSASSLAPPPVNGSSILIELEYQGQAAPASNRNDIASPVAIEDRLYVVNQREAIISMLASDGTLTQVIGSATQPAGVTQPTTSGTSLTGILSIAGEGDKAYVAYYSTTLPEGFDTPDPLPTDPRYPAATPRYELIFSYDRGADGSFTNPTPLKAFEASTNGHRSGGMLVLPDGKLLYARGDNLRPAFDGLSAPQETETSVSKLLIIDPETKTSEIAGQGLRNVQRLTYTDDAKTQIAFADIGWQVAEEINQISVADVLDTATIENFGWGRNADGLAREGTFYVNEGPENVAQAVGEAPEGEAGFIQPFAQFGREDRTGFFAASGPVASSVSFSSIGMLFGDLASGDLFATLAGASGTNNDVYSVMVKGPDDIPTTLADLFGGGRDDPRFFNFSDNSAGLLLERSGGVYRITEVSQISPVPLPAGGWLLGALLGLGGVASRLGDARKSGPGSKRSI